MRTARKLCEGMLFSYDRLAEARVEAIRAALQARRGCPGHGARELRPAGFKEDLKAFDEFAAYSRVDPRAKAELVGKLCEAATRGDCAELRELIAEGAEVD